jgi:hypothetical protein
MFNSAYLLPGVPIAQTRWGNPGHPPLRGTSVKGPVLRPIAEIGRLRPKRRSMPRGSCTSLRFGCQSAPSISWQPIFPPDQVCQWRAPRAGSAGLPLTSLIRCNQEIDGQMHRGRRIAEEPSRLLPLAGPFAKVPLRGRRGLGARRPLSREAGEARDYPIALARWRPRRAGAAASRGWRSLDSRSGENP